MDRASIHIEKNIRPLIEEVGASLEFLSPYSPDFSPIENIAFLPQKKLNLGRKIRTKAWTFCLTQKSGSTCYLALNLSLI